MRIKNKYIRNRSFRVKYWKRIRNTEHPYRTFCPHNGFTDSTGYWHNGKFHSYEADAQVQRHFEWIDQRARYMDSGTHKTTGVHTWSRRQANRELRAEQKAAMSKVRHGDYDAIFPPCKHLLWD